MGDLPIAEEIGNGFSRASRAAEGAEQALRLVFGQSRTVSGAAFRVHPHFHAKVLVVRDRERDHGPKIGLRLLALGNVATKNWLVAQWEDDPKAVIKEMIAKIMEVTHADG